MDSTTQTSLLGLARLIPQPLLLVAEMNIFYVPLLVLKGNDFTTKYFLFFPRGLDQMEGAQQGSLGFDEETQLRFVSLQYNLLRESLWEDAPQINLRPQHSKAVNAKPCKFLT